LLWVFWGQGILAEDVTAHIPFIVGRTVVHPSPYVGLEGLDVPSQYRGRVHRDPGFCRGLILTDLLKLANRAEIEAVVWFLLDHEHWDSFGLAFGEAPIDVLMSIYRDWPANKPLFIVADSSCSTQFAKSVMEGLVRYRHCRPTAGPQDPVRQRHRRLSFLTTMTW
jgi:hypothetical protein